MPTDNFTTYGRTTIVTSKWVNDSAPYPIYNPPPPNGNGAFIGYMPGSGHFVKTQTESPVLVSRIFRDSYRTPLFKSPKRKLPILPLLFDFNNKRSQATGFYQKTTVPSSASNGPGSAGYVNETRFLTNSLSYGTFADTSSSWVTGLKSKATSNLLKNLRDSSFNAAQALAERKQTADLIASSATKIAKSLRNLRRGNFAKAAQDLGLTAKKRANRRFNSQFIVDQGKAVGNGWLELQYGWKPLLSDVYGATEALAKANNPAGNQNSIYRTVTGRARREEIVQSRSDLNRPGGSVGYSYRTDSGSMSVLVKTGVTYMKTSAPLASLASVGITNPALLAWELLPYSFVVDWFLPIGNYLESLDATSGLSFYSGYVTVFRKYRGTVNVLSSYSENAGYYRTFETAREDNEMTYCTRTPLSSFPSAPMPTFKNPLSNSHVASAMALLLQLKR